MWKIDVVVVGPIQCNCYILSDPVSGKACLIDPGAESEELITHLRNKKLEIQAILITHCHIDHVGGIESVRSAISCPVYYHAGDRMLYENLEMQAGLFGMRARDLQARQPNAAEGELNDEQEFDLSSGIVKVIHTPGHTPGSVCFHASGDEHFLFTGDTLFQGSIGRTDLWGGSFPQIMDSIKNRLMTLDDRVRVLPGHGDETTIGDERRSNPFLNR